MEDKALGLLGLMRRARAVEPGTDSACDAVKEGKAKLLLISADISDTARRKAENAANGRRVLIQPIQYTRAELASAFGGYRLCKRPCKNPCRQRRGTLRSAFGGA